MNLFKVRLDKFWLNSLSLAKGTIAGQVLVISFMPVLTRLYKPSDFGVFAAVSGIIALLAAVSTMRLEQAIVLPKNDEEAWSLFKSSTFLAIYMRIFICYGSIFLKFNRR